MNRLPLPRKTSAATGRGAGPRRADPGGVLIPAAAAFGALSLVGCLPTATRRPAR
ncbi:hypothetical protein [Streptomyces californicus]|uniref:hypothetical protein n=1 Tax=Streptomyces californicus TaxID=67351 RepID=UPI0036A6C680